jgi:hypothetical protein
MTSICKILSPLTKITRRMAHHFTFIDSAASRHARTAKASETRQPAGMLTGTIAEETLQCFGGRRSL